MIDSRLGNLRSVDPVFRPSLQTSSENSTASMYVSAQILRGSAKWFRPAWFRANDTCKNTFQRYEEHRSWSMNRCRCFVATGTHDHIFYGCQTTYEEILENAFSLTTALRAWRLAQWSRQQFILVGPPSNGTWGEEYVWVIDECEKLSAWTSASFFCHSPTLILGTPQTCAAYQLAVKMNYIEFLLRRNPSHHDETSLEHGKEHEPEGRERDLLRKIIGYRLKL